MSQMKSRIKNIYYILGFVVIVSIAILLKKNNSDSTLNPTSSVINIEKFIQGKWSYEIHTGDVNATLRYRFEIKGNTIKIWSDIGNLEDPFDMNHNIESYQFFLGETTRDLDGNISKFLEFDEGDVSLTYRTLSPIWVVLDDRGGMRSDGGYPYWRRGWK